MPSAISLMVPSPPTPTISSAPRATWSCAIDPAVPGPVVGATVTAWPERVRIRTARSISERRSA